MIDTPQDASLVIKDIFITDLPNILGWSKDGATKGSALVSSGMQMVENNFLKICLHFLHLTKNDTPFSLYFLFTQHAVLNDVRENVHSCFKTNTNQLD